MFFVIYYTKLINKDAVPIVAMPTIFVKIFFTHNDRIQGLAILQQPTWINRESEFKRLNFGKPR
jgi:hypothetical protein